MLSSLAIFVVATIIAVLGQQATHPVIGDDIGDPSFDWDVILPQTVTQCEPFLIFYNTTIFPNGNSSLTMHIRSPDYHTVLITFTFPNNSIGYMDWICNIPAGHNFVAESFSFPQYYTVKPGSSSDCLGNITVTNSYYGYRTSAFQSYTQNAALSVPTLSTLAQQPPVVYPTNSYSTITLNTFLATTSATSTSSASSPPSTTSSSSTQASSSGSSKKAIIAGGVVGGVAFVLLTLIIIYFLLQRRKIRTGPDATPFKIESEPNAHPDLVISQFGSTPISTPFMPSSEPSDGSEPTFNINPGNSAPAMPVPWADTSHVASYSPSTARKSSSSSSIGSPVPQILTYHAPQSPNETRNARPDLASALGAATQLTASQRQALIANLSDTREPSSSNVQLSETRSQQSSTSGAQEEPPDLAAVLGVISRARLSTRERDALVASLGNMTLPGQPTRMDVTRGSSISSPPPYGGV